MKASAATRRDREVRARTAKPAPPPFRRKLLFEALEPRILLSAAPGTEALLLIPGFAATQAASPAVFDEWLTTRGADPSMLQIDPLSNSAADLIKTLENVGYSRDIADWSGPDAKTPLIIANWDWRVPVADRDGGAADGTLSGVTAASITDWATQGFDTSLDYLGYYLKEAADAGFSSVDIIGHSTGGLVARAYMQSAAYGQDGLPTVDDLVFVGVPQEGVSAAWNMLQDDFNNWGATRGMAHLLDQAWNLVEGGTPITGPGGDITKDNLAIDNLATAQNERKLDFERRYLGAANDLTATYDLIDTNGDGTFEPVAGIAGLEAFANTLLADLNFGAGPQDLISRAGDGTTTVIYTDEIETLGRLTQRTGISASAGVQNELLGLGEVIGHLPGSDQVWYQEQAVAGDTTVSAESARDLFQALDASNDRLSLKAIRLSDAGEFVSHSGLLSNAYSQKQIVGKVATLGDAEVSQGLLNNTAQTLSASLALGLLDPREIVLDALDDIGRLLDGVTGSTALNTDLPFVGKSVMDVLPFMASFTGAVATARAAVFEYGTLEELNEFLADELGDDFTLSFAFDDGQFTVNLSYNPSASTGVTLDVAGNTISADLEVEFNLDVAIGIDLTDPHGGKDMVFVRIDDLSATARIAEDDLDIEVNIGDLTAAIVDGSASLEVSVGLSLVDPNDDHKLTITELLDGFQHPTDFIDPSLSGTLDVVLPFDATVAGFDLGAFGTPTLEAHDADIFDAEAPEVTVNVFLDDPEVQANILALLDNGLEGIDFLNDPLPVIGQSLNDLIGFAINDILDLHDIVADYFASYETGGENEGGRADVIGLVDWVSAALAERLESLFMAGGEGPLEISGGFDLETSTIFFNLDLEAFLAQHLELAFDADNLNLEELLGFDPTRLLDLRANAEIDLEASADLHFGFDIDLSDLLDPQFSLDADSGFTAHVGGTADDLDFTLGLDVFGATLGLVVADGSAAVDLDFSAGFAKEGGDANDDGRVQFDELADSFQAVASGAATLDLPLYFPIKAMPVGGTIKDKDDDGIADNVLHAEASLSAVADSGGFSLGTDYEFITPDFTVDFDVAAALIGLLNDPQSLLDGLEGFFSGIDTVADGIDFIELPLIGGAPFDGLAGSLRGLRTDVLGHSAGGNYSDGLGKWLQDKAADPDDEGVFEAVLDMVRTEIYNGLSPLNSELFSFVVPVLDDDGNPTYDGAGKMITRLPTSADDIELRLTDDGELLFNIKFGGVLVGHREDDGTITAAPLPIDFNVGLPGLSLEVDANLLTTIDYLMGIGLGITGDPDHFVFLDTTGVTEDGEELAFDVDAKLGAGSSASGTLGFLAMHFDVVEDSGLHGHFGLDIADSRGDEQGSDPDGRLTIGETPVFSLNASAQADAMIHAVVDTVAGGVLPSVETTIEYHQLLGEINFTLGEGLHFDSGSPDVTLHDVTLNVGSVFSSFLGDALSTINDIVQPFKPVVDLLLTEVDLGITKFKMIDIARLKLPGKTVDTAEKVLEVIQSTIEFLDSLEDMTSAGGINFGDFHLTESTLEDPEAPSSPEDVAGATPDDSNLTPAQRAALKGPDQKGLDTRTSTTTPAGKRPLPTQKRFSIPILEDPASLLDFILDRGAVDLFYYDLPDLNLLFDYQKTYPVFPGLNAGFFGSIGASTNFDFGYDTRGLREWWNADFAPDKFWMIFDGFYLDDHGLENTSSDMPEVVLKAAVGAVASLGIGGLVEAGVKGGIEAKIEFDLNDRLTEFQGDTPVGDGKFYGSELISRLSHGPECLFDMHGQLSVFLEAFFWIGLDLGFSEITIFEASERFVDEIIASFDHECLLDAPRDLADLDNGVLTLRYAGDDSGGPHDYIVTHESGESLTLPYLVAQGYIDLDYYTEVELDDLRDNILPALQAGNEQIIVVTTGARAEFFRSSQVDTVRSFGTSQSDTYKIQGLNGLVSSIDIRGGDSGDIIEITANPANNSILQSLNVEGGGGDDYIRVAPALLGVQPAGVADKWVLRGGDGDDRIKLGADDSDDPAAQNPHVYSYSGVLLDGGAGNDTIFGHTGAEHIEGGDGDDLILAYGGNDLVHGGEGNDYIAGGTGADQLFGDGDDDRIFGSTGNDDIHGGEGSDTLMGEAGDDTIAGDGGDDLMVGAAGNDLLFGGDGDDRATWQLGEGLDTYSGGAGADELQMDGFITDGQAFYTDPDNYIQDDGLVDVVNVHVANPLDANGAHEAQVDWTHGAGAMITMVTGEVETLRLDAGRGADDFHIGDLQSTSLDSVRVSGGQTRGIVEEEHVARDGQGRAAGQDLTLSGDAGDQFRLRVGNYGAASALITLVDDGTGHIDFQSTAISIQDALRSLVGVVTLDVTYDAASQKYKVTGLGDVADALLVKDAAVQATAKTLQELTLAVSAGQMFSLKLGPSGAPSTPIEVMSNGLGGVDTGGTAMNIELALRALTGNSTVEVVYGTNTYRISGLGDSAPALALASPPPGVTLVTGFSQELVVDGLPGQQFALTSGSMATDAITIGATGASTAAALQSALRQLTGFGSLVVTFQPAGVSAAGEAIAASYKISGFAAGTAALQLAASAGTPVTATSGTTQKLSLTGTAGQQFRLQLGSSGLPSDVLTLATDANGELDTEATAAAIQEAVRALTHSPVPTVAFDAASSRYVVKGLDGSTAALQVNTTGLASNVTGSSATTRTVALVGDAGQQFRLKFGPGGSLTGLVTIGATDAATAASMQTQLRALFGGTSITVTFDADADAFNVDGLLAPADALVLHPSSPAGGATFTSAPGVDIFKVFKVGPDEAVDTIVIEGSTGADDYRVSSLQAIGVDGKAETSLRYEQLNGQLATTGQPLSYVVVDVFGLERTDYVRLNTLGGADHIDATAVIDPVVSHLYLDGGEGGDRIIGSNIATTADVILGGAGNDRLTGGAGVDQFFENTVGDDGNTAGDFDTLIETRDADFYLSDTSLRIDDRILHNQFGNEVEQFGDIFEAVELYGLDGANRFELSGWSDSGLLDGYKGGDTYVLELASAVVSRQSIFINDTGASGIDSLTFKGSAGADFIQLDTVYDPAQDPDHRFDDARWAGYGNHGDGLIIAHFNPDAQGYGKKDLDDEDALFDVNASSLTAGANFQVINYHTVEQVVVFGGAGNDTFISDSTAAQIDLYGNEGDDQFYVGSVLETEDVIVEGQIITIVKQITDGAVFNNSSYYGGDGDDYFEVNHNAADINLFGDNGDDTFLVKALLTINEDDELVDLDSKVANVSGTFGQNSDQGTDITNDTREVDVDTLVYVENANVNIDGGAGFDAVSLVGTVLSDTFYIYTEVDPATGKPVQRIYGAGVKLQKLLNIERLQVLAGGGDDTIYLYGSDMGPIGDMVIKAGSGSDTIIVGGAAQTINLSFPKNSDQFYSTVEGYQVDKDALGKFIRVGEVDGLPFYQVRSLTRIAPFTVENPAHTTQIVMPASYSLEAFKAPVIIDGGAGLHDVVQMNLTLGTQQAELSDRLLLKKDVEFNDAKLHLAATSADPLVQALLAAGGTAGAEARDLLNGAIESYIRFADRYDQPGLVSSLQALSGAQKLDVDVPAGIGYFNIQNTLVDNDVLTAREQLIDFANTFGLTLTWKDVVHPDPSRAAAGEMLHELLSIKKGGVSLAFEAMHSELVVFNGSTKTIVKDLTGLTLKTTATLKATFDAGAITSNVLVRSDAVDTIAPAGAKSRLHFSGFDTMTVQLSQLPGGSKLTVDNDNFTGRIEINGGTASDLVFLKTVAAETVVHGGDGDDTITVGRNGLLDGIGAPLQLFGDAGNDQITIDDTADTSGRGVTLEQELLQHSTTFEQLSRITDALSLKGITAAENATIADKLEDAAVPYGEAALNVDAADLTAYRDYAAAGLLENLKTTVSGLSGELSTAVSSAVALLKDRDQALLENQIKLYVRARYYEGSDGKFLTDELLRLMNVNDGMQTWLRYEDWDSYWSPFSTHWYIDWGTSNNVAGDWDIKGGLNEIRKFFQDPNGTFASYGEAGVSNSWLAGTYLPTIENLLKGSLYSLMVNAYYAPDKLKLLGGGQLDDDENMWLYLKASGVNTATKRDNLFALSRIYDEAVNNYAGSSGIYSSLLQQRGLSTSDLNTLYNQYKDDPKIRGFSWSETNYGKSQMIGSVGDFTIEVAQQYRKLTPDVANRVNALQSSFTTVYQGKINDLQSSIQTAITNHDYSAATLNSIKTKTDQLTAFFNPATTQSADSGITAEATFAKAPVYNRLVTGTGNGVTTLLGEVADLSQKIQNGNFAAVAAKAGSTDFTVLRNEFNSAEYHNVRVAYQAAAQLVDDFTLFNARYLGDAARPAALDSSVLDIKRQDRAADTFSAFDQALQGTFNFDAFRTAFLTTQESIAEFLDLNPDYSPNILLESRAGAQADSLAQDAKDIAQPVAVNRIQYNLFNAALTKARSDLASLQTQLYAQYTVTRSYWWFSQTYHLDYTNDARYIQQRDLVNALQQKVTKSDGFADASDAQSAKLNSQEAGYAAQENAAGAKVDAKRAQYEALKDQINGQFTVLKELSKFAIDVLKQSRPGQSAAGFVDTNSLISELSAFSDEYSVLPAGSAATPTDSSVFLAGSSANSVVQSEQHTRFSSILSVKGLGAQIHIGRDDVEGLSVLLGGADDEVTVLQSLAAGNTTVDLGAGSDYARVKAIDGATTINAGNGADTVDVYNDDARLYGIDATLTINGGAASDTINLVNTFDFAGTPGTLTATTLTGLGMGGGIAYGGTETINLSLGVGDDNLTIQSTAAGVQTNVFGDLGDDVVTVLATGGLGGTTNLFLAEGADTVNITGSGNGGLQAIQGDLIVAADLAGTSDGQSNTLNISDATAQDKSGLLSGSLTASTLTGLAMGGVVQYGGFETLNLTLGRGADNLVVQSTMGGITNISGGIGSNDLDDTIKLETLAGQVNVAGGYGNDAITLFDGAGDFAAAGTHLTIDGARGDDTITLNLGRRTGLAIDVTDSDPVFGLDNLIVNGTAGADAVYLGAGDKSIDLTAGVLVIGQKLDAQGRSLFYRQATSNGLPDGDPLYDADGLPQFALDAGGERIETTDISEFPVLLDNPSRDTVSYMRMDKLTVQTFGGDDVVQMDDNAVETVINLGTDDDRITIATVATTPDQFGIPVVNFEQTTRGSSAKASIYGGDGNDEFNVNHNEAELFLYGENGDDVFAVFTFLVLKDEANNDVNLTTLDGGEGHNSYEYLQNAPVHVNGGAGNDTLIITGTPIADVFIVTDKYVAGAGRQVLIEDNVEKVIIQGAGGDDEIYVLSTKGGSGFETIVRGGSGNDHVHVGGEPPVMVFDPPPTIIKPAPIQQVRYVIEQTPVVIDPPAFTRTVPLADIGNLQAYAAQYRDPGGNAQVSLQSINSAPISFSFWFFSWTVSLPVSATIRIDPVAYTTYTTRVVQQVTTITPPVFTVDPPPFAFKAAGTQDLTGIRGKLTIDGGIGQDSVVVHDGGGAAGTGIMTGDTLTGLGLGASGVSYTGVENMDVRLGAGADTFTVEQSIAGTTRIDAGGGNDTINIEAISGDTTIWGAAGNDTINVHDDASTLAGIGATLTVDGDAHLDEQTVNWVNGTPATDVPATPLVVNSLGQQFTTVDANGVKTFHPGPDGLAYVNVAKLNPDGSVMKDALEKVITERVLLPFPNKQVTVQSLAGHDTLNIVNTGENGNVTATLDASSFDASNMPGRIVYSHSPSTIEDLNITLGGGNDTADILGTNIATATYLHTGDGNDVIRVGENGSLDGIAGTLTLDAGAGLDNRLIIDDSADADADGNVQVSAASVTGIAAAAINYRATDGFFRSAWSSVSGAFSEGISILLGRGNDTATVTSTRDNAGVVEVTAVHANDGDDHIVVADTDARYLTVHGDGGKDHIDAVLLTGAQNGLTAFGGDGDDTITGGIGSDVLVGGLGIDTINGGAGNDVVVGDSAAIVRDAFYKVQRISGLADEADGDDVLSTSEGNDVVIGGGGNDDIDAISDGSIIVGDAGTVVYADGSLEEWSVFTLVGVRGNDTIDSGANAIVLGGGGDDVITLGGGTNTVVGDEGVVSRDGPGFDQVTRVVAASGLGGGADRITSSGGHNIILGGQGSDIIDAAAGSNVVLGDDGQAFFGYHGLWHIETDDALGGGDDRITGGADNTILGGVGRDTISAGGGTNTILGDGGMVERAEGGEVLRVRTVDFFLRGDNDNITLGNGINTVLGGLGSDTIDASGGTNVILGDDGEVVIGGDVTSARIDLGATDFITAGSNNTILGGAGADEISAQGGTNTILGDNGTVKRSGGVVTQVLTTDDDFAGGNDHIVLGNGTNTVLGGMGADIIEAPGGTNIILGDNGEVNVGGAVLSRQPGLGGDDIITAGSNNTILGGAGADRITAGGGTNTILGDNGTVERTAGDVVTHVFTADVDGTTGGDDIIKLGNGTNTVLGGMGADTITAPGGINIVLGDNGDVVIGGDVVSTQLGQGGNDTITAGSNNTILGGAGADEISAQGGTNTILGDNGTVKRAGGVVTQVFTADQDGTTGGNDHIVLGNGTNTVLGGMGADTIEAPGGINIILGDNGEVNVGGTVLSKQPGLGGDDIIIAGSNNTILGGAGADRITAGGGTNTILGDNGTVERAAGDVVTHVFTADVDGSTGGNDIINLGNGTNTVLGGMGADIISAPGGINIVLGDNGDVVIGGDVVSTQFGQGGDDIITAGSNNTILGGAGADQITAQGGTNTILGDNGTVQRSGGAVTKVFTADVDGTTGGNDHIVLGDGTNTVLGGMGADFIEAPGGINIILGDNGEVNVGGDVLSQQFSLGGDDIITAGSNNTILGGAGADQITAQGGTNTILGDNGTVKRAGGAVTQVFTADIDGTTGGNDRILLGQNSINTVLGGMGADVIDAPGGVNIILGDNGEVNVGGDVRSTQTSQGGADIITAGSNNTILGGFGGDSITLGAGSNTVLGDNGTVQRSGGVVTRVVTNDADASTGGVDTIRSQGGTNIILGGVAGDVIDAALGVNIVLGDNGEVNAGGDVFTTQATIGGADIITGGANNIILGGAGGDSITLGAGSNTVLGDNGTVKRSGGVVTQVFTADEDGTTGGADTIISNGGSNIILGGSFADTISAPGGTNIILGDNGVVIVGGDVYTTQPTIGGADRITGGSGNNIILGGAGNDLITGGAGRDIALGDNGIVKRTGGNVTRVETTDTCIGGDDVITGGAGDNILIGGAGNDIIDGGAGNEIMVGGAGTVDLTGALPLVTSGDDICDGTDIIHGGDGNDTIWGGGGNDQLYGGLGNDKIYGQGGNDIILGDVGQIIGGKDVLLTDVAHVTAEMALNGSGMPAANAATVNALLDADVVLLAGVNNADGSRKLNSDGTWASRALLLDLAADGDDTISGGDGDDQIFGQRGNDILTGDAGNDALSGGAGNDRVDGGTGNDTLVGDDVTIDSPTATFGNVMHGYLVDGVTVVPALQVAPGDTPNAAAAALATIFGNPAMPASSNLPTSGGTLTAYASVLTDFGHHLGQLNGNDTVIGGLGDDTLIGDDQSVIARTVTFDAPAMARTEALTRALLDITDDFSDMVHAQYSQIGCNWWDDHDDWWDHDDDVVVDSVFTVGADSLDGGDGNDVLIGDDSLLAETTFTLQVGYADDVERFVEGMADAGNEAADSLLDLVYLDQRLHDQDVLVKHGSHWDHETVHHITLVAMGNDTLNGGAGNDLMVGDAFTMRTAQINLVAGGTVPNPSDDDAWKNTDWCDDNHFHWWFDDHGHHDWNEDWHFGSVTSSADVINAGAGNDLVWGDSLAVQSSTITRGAGISNSNWSHAEDDAEDALCSLVSLTDTADFWLTLQDGGHCDNDYGDTINGGDGDDILFGQAGSDKLKGENGNDWLIGGEGSHDYLDGGSGSDKTSNGNDNSSTLRSTVSSRLVNWKDSFKNYGVPFSPFGGLKATKYGGGCSDRDSFDFLTLDA